MAAQSSPPATVATDEVVPFRFWDGGDTVQKLVMEFTYRFDDVLDPAKLKSALERLLEIGEWKGLGARFRKTASGTLEHHIPTHFNDKRPGFVWSQEHFDQSIRDHPVASTIPTSSDLKHPTIFPSPETYHDLVTSPGHATKFSDWTETDRPALSVHVVSFQDATLLTISWSHVFLDALGRQSLLKAWTAVLEGREEDVPDFVPFRIDPIEQIAQGGDPKKHVLHAHLLTGIWFVLFVASYLYEILVHSKEASHTICCPGPWVESLRQQAMTEAQGQEPDGAEDVFLSHGDVLLAWWTKVSIAAQPLSSSQPISIMNVTNCRGLFPEHLPASEKVAYTSNAAIPTHTFTTSGELSRISVGSLALRLRRDLQTQRTPEQTRHFVAGQIESTKQYGRLPLAGAWNQLTVAWSNWHRGRFYDTDFSTAVVKPGTPLENRANKLGQPSFILVNGHMDGISMRNAGPLLGRDANGNWWMQPKLRVEAWPQVIKHFEALEDGVRRF